MMIESKKCNNINEAYIVDVACRFLAELDFAVYKEFPNMGQSVDLVVKRKHDDSLNFIEFKIADWRRAVAQCRSHQLVADYIWIGIATVKVNEKLISICKSLGYGIIHFNRAQSAWRIVQRPKKNTGVWPPRKQIAITRIKALDYGCTALDDIRNVC